MKASDHNLYLRKVVPPSITKTAFLVIIEESNIARLLANVSRELFSINNFWLIETQSKKLENLFFPIDSQVFTFHWLKNGLVIEEVYSVDYMMEQLVKNIGGWNQTNGLVLNPLPLFERRKDFLGYQIKAEAMAEPPYVIVNMSNLELGLEKQIGGILGEIWHDNLEKTMNFTTLIRPTPDKLWGSQTSNGSWNGMINGIIQNRSQVGLSYFYWSLSRASVVDFSQPLTTEIANMFIKDPNKVISWTTYIQPFDVYVWICIFILFLLMVICLTMTYIFGPEKDLNPGSFEFQNSFTIIIGSLVGQGSWLDPKSMSTKIVLLTSFLFAVVLITSFSAKLVSFSTVTKLPFKGLDDTLRKGYSIGSVKGSLYPKVISALSSTAAEIIRRDPACLVDSIEAGLAKAKKEKYAFVWATDAVKDTNMNNCNLIIIPEPIHSAYTSIAWSKNFSHQHFFNYFINKMKETGQLDRIVQKWLNKPRPDCEAHEESTGIQNTVSIFTLLGVSVILSALVFLIEVLGSCIRRSVRGEGMEVNNL